jgi:hypothetical protein
MSLRKDKMEDDTVKHEPTTPAYVNPYEAPTVGNNPYEIDAYGLPPIPPPPPTPKRKVWPVVVSLTVVIAILVASLVFVIQTYNRPITKVTPTQIPTAAPSSTPTQIPTAAPTATPTQIPTVTPSHTPIIGSGVAPYSAASIAEDFIQAGLVSSNGLHIDTNWRCCTYYPEGGAVYWLDTSSGNTLDLATFARIDETQIDASDLERAGYHGSVVNNCLLSYGGNKPSDYGAYVTVMQQNCF